MNKLMEDAAASFARDTARHEMRVILDSGIHRHLRFRRSDCSSYWFDVITAPGVLMVTGDMGTYAFRRLDDMFQFFRDGRINPSYWGEKCEAMPSGGLTRFDEESFLEWAKEEFDSWAEGDEGEDVEEARSEFMADMACLAGEGEERAVIGLLDYRLDGWQIDEPSERRYTIWDYQYLWVLHAIVWAISQYDARPKTESEGGETD